MNSTEIRDRFLSEAQELIRDEGWNLPDAAGDEDDLVTEIFDLSPDPEAFDNPREYILDLESRLSLGHAFEDAYEHLKRDVIWTADIERIYRSYTDECDTALMEHYADLSEAAEGCWSIGDLMTKAVLVWVDQEWRVFLSVIDNHLQDVIDDISSDLDALDDEDE